MDYLLLIFLETLLYLKKNRRKYSNAPGKFLPVENEIIK